MGIGPVPASRKALERAGLALDDMDVIEINEAFVAQVLACLKAIDIAHDDSRLNPNGIAIQIVQHLGASGARQIETAHVCTPVLNAHIVCMCLLDNKKNTIH